MAQKQWMWQNEANGGVQAAIADFDDNIIMWFDEPGCACAGNDAEQTFADFMDVGPRALTPPDDVVEEMRSALNQLGNQPES